MSTRRRALAVAAAVLAAGCDGAGSDPIAFDPPIPADATSEDPLPSIVGPAGDGVDVVVDAAAPGDVISPLILGVSSSLSAAELDDAGLTLNSWGGNPSTRFNYLIGHAWNHGADYEFRNTNYGSSGDEMRQFLTVSAEAGIASRVAVPTLGWVARDDLDATCSFPEEDGGCADARAAGTCEEPGRRADPRTANIESSPEAVAAWVEGLVADGYDLTYVAMDNEPELWGATHYDVHPECPTYEEILDKYLAYARAIRAAAPDAQLTGPVMCCWFDYWRTAPGPADGSGEPFLEWFLRAVNAHDDQYGQRTLDVVDVHFYPQSGVFNNDTDLETSARRLRAVRALWDPEYVDESWIDATIRFIPRMRETIERSYPGTPLMVSEWNFGAEESVNGALAIADVLGIYGREGVAAAAYWRHPPVGSPGWMAFKMHGNYDDMGGRFGGAVLPVELPDNALLTGYAALDDGVVKVMLINKDPARPIEVDLVVHGFEAAPAPARYTYGAEAPGGIVESAAQLVAPIVLPASSITVLELAPA